MALVLIMATGCSRNKGSDVAMSGCTFTIPEDSKLKWLEPQTSFMAEWTDNQSTNRVVVTELGDSFRETADQVLVKEEYQKVGLDDDLEWKYVGESITATGEMVYRYKSTLKGQSTVDSTTCIVLGTMDYEIIWVHPSSTALSEGLEEFLERITCQ